MSGERVGNLLWARVSWGKVFQSWRIESGRSVHVEVPDHALFSYPVYLQQYHFPSLTSSKTCIKERPLIQRNMSIQTNPSIYDSEVTAKQDP